MDIHYIYKLDNVFEVTVANWLQISPFKITNCNIWVILGLRLCKFIISNKIWIGKTWVTWPHQDFFQLDDKTQMIVHLNPGLDHAKAEIMTRSIWNWDPLMILLPP